MKTNLDNMALLLRHLAKELQGLSKEEKDLLSNGDAQLKIVVEPKLARKSAAETSPSPELIELRQRLESCVSREEVRGVLVAPGIAKGTLQRLTRMLDLPYNKDDAMERLIERLIESVVGFRLRSHAIQGKGEATADNLADLPEEKK